MSIPLIAVLTAGISVVSYQLQNYLLTTITGAFLFRLAFIIVDSVVGFLPTVPISSGHNRRAIDLATAWSNGQFVGALGDVTTMRIVMAHLLAPFYVVLGHSPVVGRIGIALVSLLVGYLVFKLARHVTDYRTSVLAASIVLFWPTIVYRSVVIQREVVLVVVMLTFLWAAVQWLDSVTLRTAAIAFLATAATFALRRENLVLIVAMVGFVSLVKSRDKPYLTGLTLLSVPFLAFFALNFETFTGHGSTLSPAALESFAYGRAHGDAVYLMGLHYDTWLDIILYAPMKVLYFLFTPFPWHIQSVTELFVGMSALALLVATLFVRRGIAILHDRPYYLGLLLSYFLTGVVTYSIIEMNYGAAVRRRIQFIPILLLLAVVGLSNVEFDVRWPTR
ncbi:glycosyltransferase family 39 protein [Halobacterium noricense]|uniref:glycosyltransferase family 39 protein n=1 Tax=Halobacterium noricense TaxID=223182 RepID=UPI001E63009C|nr:glycosyltransferase family 39 protein [Halobacterium noricense]UHH26575.1 glycosyltransferase family 39 protein [Halobacterium noricense]